MKTYTYLVGILPMVFLVACSKPATEPLENETSVEIKNDYSVLLNSDGNLDATSITASNLDMSIGPKDSTFPNFSNSQITHAFEGVFTFYNPTESCDGRILMYDLEVDDYQIIDTFLNTDACSLEVTAIAHWNSYVFLSYVKSEIGKEDSFYIRIIDTKAGEATAVDVSIDLRPLSLTAANGKIFVLTWDDMITDENGLSVIDVTQQAIIYEKLIGFDAKKIFKDSQNNIIISYPELHTTLNSNTYVESYTQYGATLRPNLFTPAYYIFDKEYNFYYIKDSETEVAIPAFYNFQQNKVTLYYFENYLSENQLNMELNIESATAVGYDSKNNFILVGYKKNGSDNSGGILRLTPTPNFSYVDNIDLDGIPKAILAE